jgi:hypothetical protein
VGAADEVYAVEMVDFEDTACESAYEIWDEIQAFFSYVRRFMEVFDDTEKRVGH